MKQHEEQHAVPNYVPYYLPSCCLSVTIPEQRDAFCSISLAQRCRVKPIFGAMEQIKQQTKRLAKICHDMCAPDQILGSCVQYWLLPERAPEWYRKLVLGTGSADVHVRSAPRDSLPLLGHIELAVPKLEEGEAIGSCHRMPNSFGWKALAVERPTTLPPGSSGLTWALRRSAFTKEVLLPGLESPSESKADMLNMLGRTLDTKIVEEMREARTDSAIASSPRPVSKNALALSDAVIHLPKRTQIQGAARFYEHYLGSAITKKYAVYEASRARAPDFFQGRPSQAQALMDICMVHFGPASKLHQTLTYKADNRYT
eukprot:Skav214928  [mRNA]  locus=scaffold2073:264322:270769:- [translate_table: standard]